MLKNKKQNMKPQFYCAFVITGLFLACLLMLSGCGEQESKMHIWGVADSMEMDIPGAASYDFMLGNGTVFYACQTDWDAGEAHVYRKDLNSDEPCQELEMAFQGYEGSQRIPLIFNVDGKGNLYLYWRIINEEGGVHNFLCKYAEDGRELMCREITDPTGGSVGISAVNIVVDEEGRIYLICIENIYLYDRDGEYQGKVEGLEGLSSNYFICASGSGRDGKAYFTKRLSPDVYDEWELVEVDFEEKKTGAAYGKYPAMMLKPSMKYIYPGIQHDFLLGNSDYLYGYQLESQKAESIVIWSELDILGSDVQYFCELENGDILVVEQTKGELGVGDVLAAERTKRMLLLRLSELEEIPDRETITLGVIGSVSEAASLQRKAAEFNRMQDTYRVELRVYDEGTAVYDNISTTYESEEAIQAMTLELVGGNGPDLIAYNGNFPIYASKGMLEDLNGYLEKSEVLSREDYLETALDMFTFSGRLTALPTYFTLQTVYGYTDQVGEEKGLSLEQFLGLASDHPQMPLACCAESESLLIILCRQMLMSFVDMDTGDCLFEAKGFDRLLEFIQDSPKVDLHLEKEWPDREDPVLGSDYLLECAEIGNMSGIVKLRALGRPVTLVGYPSEEGEGIYMCAYTNYGSIGISSGSRHKEGAWDFLEYLYSTMETKNSAFAGFPAKNRSLEKYLEGEIGETCWIDGEEYKVTQEDVELIWDLIRAAELNRVNLYGNTIGKIVDEEAQTYFAGDKTAQEATHVIQNRVQIYLNEEF